MIDLVEPGLYHARPELIAQRSDRGLVPHESFRPPQPEPCLHLAAEDAIGECRDPCEPHGSTRFFSRQRLTAAASVGERPTRQNHGEDLGVGDIVACEMANGVCGEASVDSPGQVGLGTDVTDPETQRSSSRQGGFVADLEVRALAAL